MCNNFYKINGYGVKHTYAGIDQYTIYEGEKEVCTCWCLDDVAKYIHTTADVVKAEMWKQRYV